MSGGRHQHLVAAIAAGLVLLPACTTAGPEPVGETATHGAAISTVAPSTDLHSSAMNGPDAALESHDAIVLVAACMILPYPIEDFEQWMESGDLAAPDSILTGYLKQAAICADAASAAQAEGDRALGARAQRQADAARALADCIATDRTRCRVQALEYDLAFGQTVD